MEVMRSGKVEEEEDNLEGSNSCSFRSTGEQPKQFGVCVDELLSD